MTVKDLRISDSLSQRRPTVAELNRRNALVAYARNTEFERAALLIAQPQQNWSQLYGAMLEIEFAIRKSISEAGFCSSETREHFIWSAHYAAIVSVFHRGRLVVDVESPEPMQIEEAYSVMTEVLAQALSRER